MLDKYVRAIEAKLCTCLRADTIPPLALQQVRCESLIEIFHTIETHINRRRQGSPSVHHFDCTFVLACFQAIAVAKVKAVEGSINLCFALKQEVGSFALMTGTGFEQMDFLQMTKFAEGDSRILTQKMARDLVRSGAAKATQREAAALSTLQAALRKAEATASSKQAAWDACWPLVYNLAEEHMASVLDSIVPGAAAQTPAAVMRSIGAPSGSKL